MTAVPKATMWVVQLAASWVESWAAQRAQHLADTMVERWDLNLAASTVASMAVLKVASWAGRKAV